MEAYRKLDASRLPGESFSDTVLRLSGQGASAAELVRQFAREPVESSEDLDGAVREVRKELNRSFKRRRRA